MIQVHVHSLGVDMHDQQTHWSNAEATNRQKNMFGKDALAVLFKHYWAPIQPRWADGECFEIRFV